MKLQKLENTRVTTSINDKAVSREGGGGGRVFKLVACVIVLILLVFL